MKKLSILFGVGAALAMGVPAHAQTGNASDVTGTNTTGSTTVAGGAFSPTTQAQGGGGGGAAAASPAVTAAVGAAATSVANALSTGSLTTPSGVPVPPQAQAAVLSVLTGQANAQAVAEVQAALDAAGVPPATVAAVMQAINALLGDVGVAAAAASPLLLAVDGDALRHPALAASLRSPYRIAPPDPVKLTRAVEAFNTMVIQSSEEYLRNPPGEFQAIHATLNTMVEAYRRAGQ